MKIPDSGPQWPRHFQSQPLALTPLPRCSPLHPTMYFLELNLSKSEKGKSVNTPANVDLLASHLKFTLGFPLLKRALWDVLRMVFARCVQYRDWDTLETLYTWLMHDQGHRHEADLRCGSFHSQVLPSSVVALPKKKNQNSSWIIREASYILSAPVLPLHDSQEMLSEAPPFPSKLLSRASQLCQRHQSNIWGYFTVTSFQVFHNFSFTFSHIWLTWQLPQADWLASSNQLPVLNEYPWKLWT